jgi:membrane-associated protein
LGAKIKKHLQKAENSSKLRGNKTIVIARFVPIIRTFMPFIDGIGQMDSFRFAVHTIISGILWVFSCIFASYFFDNIPVIKEIFSVVILIIIISSLFPIAVEFIRNKSSK